MVKNILISTCKTDNVKKCNLRLYTLKTSFNQYLKNLERMLTWCLQDQLLEVLTPVFISITHLLSALE